MTAFWLYRSIKRPGVATKISAPLHIRCICGLIFTPPNTTALLSGRWRP
ncbi:Uncharacterised protein [Vibrio cholerae]|nr:Uncharacterised protein [Vibrio cholerae]